MSDTPATKPPAIDEAVFNARLSGLIAAMILDATPDHVSRLAILATIGHALIEETVQPDAREATVARLAESLRKSLAAAAATPAPEPQP